MRRQCAICEKPIPRSYFCWHCYEQWKEDIISHKPWVEFLFREEQKRRRERHPEMIYLGDKWDLSTEGELVYRDNEYDIQSDG